MNAQFIVIITLSVIAIVVRLTFLHLYPPVAPYSDMSAYDGLAWRLAQGLGYVTLEGAFTAYWPVGYPAFLSVMYLVCGHEPGCGYFANLVLAAAIVVAVYLLIAKLSGSQTAAVAGARCLWRSIQTVLLIAAYCCRSFSTRRFFWWALCC